MPKSKLLYYTDDSESEVEVEIENVVENPPLENVPKEPEPVNEVISVEPQKPPEIPPRAPAFREPKKRGRKKREEPKNQSWEEYIDDNIENKMPIYNCPECNKDFKRKHFLKRHLEEMRCSAVREKLKKEKESFMEEQKKQMEQKPVKPVKEKPVRPVKEKPVKPVKETPVKTEEYIQKPQNQGRPAITFRFA